MNKERKLAFFSAVNIDGGAQQDVGKREGESWLRDPRINEEFQIGNEFYGKQSTFEADRSANPFDRGHLVRRLDATWGNSVDEAKEHGDDSFHFTNCSPQFWSFNQGKQLWAGLEDYTRDELLKRRRRVWSSTDRSSTAPTPTVPICRTPRVDRTRTRSSAAWQIPKYFWKILVSRGDDRLRAAAFIVSQRNLIMDIDRIQDAEKLSAEDVQVFQIPILDLAKLTRLDFGSLAQADSHEATAAGPRLIETYDDIRI